MRRDALTALSLANLAFYSLWARILDPDFEYYAAQPGTTVLWVTLLNLFLLALILWLTSLGWRRRPELARFGRAVFLCLLLLALRVNLGAVNPSFYLGGTASFQWALPLLAMVVVALMFLPRHLARVTHVAVKGLRCFSPFILMTLGIVAWHLFVPSYRERFHDRVSAEFLPAQSGQVNFLLVVLDEFDYGQAVGNRQSSLQMPELDKWRSISLSADHAMAPASETALALPSLLTGRTVTRAQAQGANELLIQHADGPEWEKWSSHPGLIADIRSRGMNLSLSGFFHPYCRLFGDLAVHCVSVEVPLFGNEMRGLSLTSAWLVQSRRIIHEVLEALHLHRRIVEPEVKQAAYRNSQILMRQVSADLHDPRFGFWFLHLGVPHRPTFFDRHTRAISFISDASYLDALAYSDLLLGELRQDLESSGHTKDTIVLFTSDHHWRYAQDRIHNDWTPEDATITTGPADDRVPFLLHFPGQNRPFTFSAPVSTVLTRDLVLACLRGDVRDPVAAAHWLQAHPNGVSASNVKIAP